MFCVSDEAAYEIESLLVDDEFIKRNDTYNFQIGGKKGTVGWNFINQTQQEITKKGNLTKLEKYGKEGLSEISKQSARTMKERGTISDARKKSAETRKNAGTWHNGHNGKHHTEDHKDKISKSLEGKYTGEQNSAFGKMWICLIPKNDSKLIYKEDFHNYEQNGWIKGRIVSEETKMNQSKSQQAIKKTGIEHHSFGKICVFNNELDKNKTIKKEELDDYITNGWIRKQKKHFKKKIDRFGEKAPTFGKMWIFSDELEISKFTNKEQLNDFLSRGWKRGRKMKF